MMLCQMFISIRRGVVKCCWNESLKPRNKTFGSPFSNQSAFMSSFCCNMSEIKSAVDTSLKDLSHIVL